MNDAVLQGDLSSFKLPDVLTFLSTSGQSGTVVVTSEGRTTRVVFNAGAVVYAGSDQEKLRLGTILLQRKKITLNEFSRIDDLVHREGGKFGQRAIQEGVMTEDQLRDYLKVQVSEVLFDAFIWPSGTFWFHHQQEIPPYAVTITIDLANLIMEGARRIEEWEQCLALLPDATQVFRAVAAKDDKVTLSADEWKILFLVNGQRSLDDLVSESGDNRLQVYRIVYGLKANKLIEPVKPPVPANDTGVGLRTTPPADETMRQTVPLPPPMFGEATMRDVGSEDDTELLVSTKARLSYSDVTRPVVAQLVIRDGVSEARTVPLTDSEYLVGRRRENHVQLVDVGVSGYHARIFRSGNGYVIEDMKSRNGTWVNGTRVFHATLQNGDQVRLGGTDLRYEVLFEPTSS